MRRAPYLLLPVLLLVVGAGSATAQAPQPALEAPAPGTPSADAPLPDIPTLMRQVEANQRRFEAVEKTYIYRSAVVREELEKDGRLKKVTNREYDNFWLDGVPVRRLVRKDGRDLTPDELAEEDKRIDKEAAEARERRARLDAQGKETDPRGEEEITVSRILELGAFTNPRRVLLDNRPTIAADYAGDPHAKTRNRTEQGLRDLSGTVWVDEQDQVLVRGEGRFVNDFKIGGGLVADLHKGTSFSFQQTRINNEVWLPAHFQAQGFARALLFFSFNGRVEVTDSDYRKFRTTTRIVPVTPASEVPGAEVRPPGV